MMVAKTMFNLHFVVREPILNSRIISLSVSNKTHAKSISQLSTPVDIHFKNDVRKHINID